MSLIPSSISHRNIFLLGPAAAAGVVAWRPGSPGPTVTLPGLAGPFFSGAENFTYFSSNCDLARRQQPPNQAVLPSLSEPWLSPLRLL